MISVKNKEPQIYYGSKPIKEVYKGSTKIYPSIDVQSIMDSMILWYDIKKQGATNESMAENPVLADLSGNGHDITCYNFAWSGMSGIGGYVYNYSTFRKYLERATIEVNSTSIRVLSVASTSAFVESRVLSLPVGTTIQQHKIKVTGLDVINIPNTILSVRLGLNPSDNDVLITEDGVYDIPLHTVDDDFNYSMSINRILEECDVLIELLPLYPNALVSDGVDDYTEAIQVFPKDKGTVIAVMQQLEGNVSVVLLMTSDKEGFSSIWDNSFYVGGYKIPSIGFCNKNLKAIVINYLEDEMYLKNTSIFTWNNSIPKITMNLNNRESKEDSIEHLHTKYNFFRDNNAAKYAKSALYSFLLFDRTLTTEEIEWVKKNMIESGGGVEDGLDAETLGKVKQ